ncbi:protein-glutamate methylesterase/protein-glutamine glutaminase [Altererythrobacter lutimaris]|uniref:Protein-glutamate methylesterase/protein-glutamine glutaminase n=1 Tax=Altererythrobacter lutimaris TaxID=2743979 RepID=A0A850HE33_9SPHN|nr:chemotaxis response regulator protein-glutamate methylesterase [Altererythrobacter lutimaris]NVE95316.1 chemotaxis response regulator protein-glutamate methylesterase [Altererythrobacter lutimaris]
MAISVLIVDDSRLFRSLLAARISQEDDIEVVGYACDAKEARTLIRELDPDVVTLDIEMPGMDGLSFLQKIMELRPTPVIIVSGSTQAGTAITAHALQLGAVSCYAKSTQKGGMPLEDGGELVRLVREAAQVGQKFRETGASVAVASSSQPPVNRPELVVLGSSTGGVEALRQVLAGLLVDCPPIVIVQHVNAQFAAAIAQSLNAVCEPMLALADNHTTLQRGYVYLAPGDARHLRVVKCSDGGLRTSLREGDPVSGHCPSVDALFHSAASGAGSKSLGILLTGMGQDGADGLLAMKQSGATTIAQDEASSVVFGMPRAAIEKGAAQSVLSLREIASYLTKVSAA